VLDGPLREIRRTHAGTRYRLEFESMTPHASALLSGGDPILSSAVTVDHGWELDLPGRRRSATSWLRLPRPMPPSRDSSTSNHHSTRSSSNGSAVVASRHAGVEHA
jgi:hypothetical protein